MLSKVRSYSLGCMWISKNKKGIIVGSTDNYNAGEMKAKAFLRKREYKSISSQLDISYIRAIL